MAAETFLAADLGASSGRVMAGAFDGRLLALSEVYRFENGPVTVAGSKHWDLLRLWGQITQGLTAANAKFGDQVRSIGVDTWGVDFALLGRNNVLLGNPYHYRDHRTDGAMDRAFAQVSRDEIFRHSGLQFMQFNTLYQLLAMKWADSPLLEMAESLLMMPDVFNWLLTGIKVNEFTNATTTQFYNPVRGHWAADLFERFELPLHLLGKIAQPGTRLGHLRQDVAEETGLTDVEVVLPGTHDTASAVMAVPARGMGEKPDWCYISSGTWSLMGLELPRPVVNDRCLELNFTNEGGVGDTIRLLKNIGGLWLIQECRRIWAKQGCEFTWEALLRLCAEAEPLKSLVNPDDATLLAPVDMPQALRDFCRRTGQPQPADEGAMVRCALESLALRYRQVLSHLEELAGTKIHTIHIVGGGALNRQLCQFTADACNRRVIAGPVEATAIGNVMMQAVAAGAVQDIAEAREVIRHSFSVEEYEPALERGAWEAAIGVFERVTGV